MNRERIASLEVDYLDEHPNGEDTVEPHVFNDPADVMYGSFPFPVVTDKLLADGWEHTGESWFVDASGWGTEGESALTVDSFRRKLQTYVQQHPDHGFGLSGVGQFQVYVSAYRRIE